MVKLIFYILVAAIVYGAYYYSVVHFAQRDDKLYISDILIGAFWPVAAPFAAAYIIVRILMKNQKYQKR